MTEWAMAKACEIQPEDLDHFVRLAEYQERAGNQAGARLTRLNVVGLLLDLGRMDEAREAAARLVAGAGQDRELRMKIVAHFERSGPAGRCRRAFAPTGAPGGRR